jgi:hypothetical protein
MLALALVMEGHSRMEDEPQRGSSARRHGPADPARPAEVC